MALQLTAFSGSGSLDPYCPTRTLSPLVSAPPYQGKRIIAFSRKRKPWPILFNSDAFTSSINTSSFRNKHSHPARIHAKFKSLTSTNHANASAPKYFYHTDDVKQNH
ncbi:hypothetical protein DFS34DRAFT_647522 [Phlyctochytrium arcticum]|nr:hypothetical protein DFS34DRAFT_647522 [Phlyctochytrium arcticum]